MVSTHLFDNNTLILILFFKGTKVIGGVMFVRLGLGIAKSAGIMTNARFNSTWRLKDAADLKRWYKKLIGHIRTGEHGVYFALQEVFGVNAANQVAEKGHANRPMGLQPSLTPAQSQARSSRQQSGYNDKDIDD
jgi:hypothetical protein